MCVCRCLSCDELCAVLLFGMVYCLVCLRVDTFALRVVAWYVIVCVGACSVMFGVACLALHVLHAEFIAAYAVVVWCVVCWVCGLCCRVLSCLCCGCVLCACVWCVMCYRVL